MTRGHAPFLTDAERKQRDSAHVAVKKAIRRGELVRATLCEQRGPIHVGGIVAHHRDGYDNVLQVTWLCSMHHGMEHYDIYRDRIEQAEPA